MMRKRLFIRQERTLRTPQGRTAVKQGLSYYGNDVATGVPYAIGFGGAGGYAQALTSHTTVTASLTPQLIDSQPQRDPSDRQGESSKADSERGHDQNFAG